MYSQTAVSLSLGREKDSGARSVEQCIACMATYIHNYLGDFTVQLLIGVKGQEGTLIGKSDAISYPRPILSKPG